MKNKEKAIKDCGGIQPEKLIAPNNVTELVFILDRSGSMAGLEGDIFKNKKYVRFTFEIKIEGEMNYDDIPRKLL